MEPMWIGLAIALLGAVVIAIFGERLRRRLRHGRDDASTPHSLWRKLFRGPRA